MADRQPYRSAAARKADILNATVDRLAEYGPEAITVRQIAERAGVQHTLVFRHFGDKAALVSQATLGELLGWAEVAGAERSPVEAFIAGFRYLGKRRTSAAALGLTLSGPSGPAVQQDTFPVVDTYVEILAAAGMQERAARDLTVAAVAIITGWVAAEDWWLAVGHYRGATGRTRARRAIEAQIRQLVEAGLAKSTATPARRPRSRPSRGDARATPEEQYGYWPDIVDQDRGRISDVRTDTRRVAVATGLTLSYGATTQRLLPPTAQLPANLGAAVGLVLLARRWGRSWSELGLDVHDAPRGIGAGSATVLPIAAALAAVTAVPAVRGLLHDDRVIDMSAREATRKLLLRVPLETALAEELLFRSALLALAGASGRQRRAVAWTSLVFGAWHVLPALHSHRRNPGAAQTAERFGGAAPIVAGTVAATALAGVGFAWLRLRSRSVLAPAIAHAALNALAFLATRRVAGARTGSG